MMAIIRAPKARDPVWKLRENRDREVDNIIIVNASLLLSYNIALAKEAGVVNQLRSFLLSNAQ